MNFYKYFMLAFILSFHSYSGQSFPYLLDWGSYVGGNGTKLMSYYNGDNGFIIDSQKNIFVEGNTNKTVSYPISYYDQFSLGGGQTLDPSIQNTAIGYQAKFNSAGQMLYGNYHTGWGKNFESLKAIDNQDNRYVIKSVPNIVHNLSTNGTWLSDVVFSNSDYTTVLTKYSPNQTVLWTTYLPNALYSVVGSVVVDQSGNVFLSGNTRDPIPGLATPGVFQENFSIFNPASANINSGFIVKLNSSGQKVWGTYFGYGVSKMEVYNNGLYLFTGYKPVFGDHFVSNGQATFQNTPAQQVIMKLNANNGQKEWSTYYGVPNYFNYYGGVYSLKINEKGIFVSGYVDENNNTIGNYYATTGSFQDHIKGSGDLFLSKFDFSGNRVWSTYFGSNNYDTFTGSTNLAILDRQIVITGNQYGIHNISTEGAFLTTPSNIGFYGSNMFFAGFDTDGNRQFCSYFGGSSTTNPDEINPYIGADGALYLWGGTNASTGVATPNGYYNSLIGPYGGEPFGYITKFSLKYPLMNVSTINNNSDLTLYDNPNRGIFTITGVVLQKGNCMLNLYDASGRLIHSQKLSKAKNQTTDLQNLLTNGTYLLEIKEANAILKTFKMQVKK